MSRVHALRLRLAGLVLALLPMAAIAAPLTRHDVAALSTIFGFDKAVTMTEDVAVSRMPNLDPNQATCVRPLIALTYSGIVDRSVRAAVPNHEAAVAWLRFAQSKGGAILLAALRESLASAIKGGPTLSHEEILSRMDDSEAAEVSAFMATPTAAGHPNLQSMSPQDNATLNVEMRSQCGVKEL